MIVLYSVAVGSQIIVTVLTSLSDPSDEFMIRYRNDRDSYIFVNAVSKTSKSGKCSTAIFVVATYRIHPDIAACVVDVCRILIITVFGSIIVWVAKTIVYL